MTTELEQGDGEFCRHPMRQGQENDLGLLIEEFGPRFAKAQCLGAWMMSEPGKNLSYRLARVLAGSHGAQLRLRMREQNADEFFTRVSRCADDGDFFHRQF